MGIVSEFLLAPTTLPSSGLLPPASLSTCIRSSLSKTPFTTGVRFASRRLARQGGTVRGWSGSSARRGGRGEGEDTDGMLDCVAFRRDVGSWRGGHWGPIAFVGGHGAYIGWLVRRWEWLAVADLEIVGRGGGRIHRWLRS